MADKEIIKQIKEQELKQYPIDFFKKWNTDNVMIPFKIMIIRFLNVYELKQDEEYNIGDNYITFAYVVNHINKRVKQAADKDILIRKEALEITTQLHFDNTGYNWKLLTVKVIQYILLFSNDIFIKSNCYKEIIEKISNPPKEYKTIVLDFFKKELIGATNFSVGTIDGMDMGISFVYNGKFYTIQNLGCQEVSENDNGYIISGMVEIKRYDTNYLSFIDKDDIIYLFKNLNATIGDFGGKMSYFIPKDDLTKSSK